MEIHFMSDTAVASGFLQRLAVLTELGGPVVMILLAMSVTALAIVLLKTWQYFSLRLHRVEFVDRVIVLLAEGNTGDAGTLMAAQRNPIARVMESAVAARERWPEKENESLVREEVARVGARYLEGLRGQLRGLEVIGSLSPLLGLLGTVLGMIEAFRQLEAAGSRVDPALLSGGIWEALLTTAVGLAVAIPVVFALNWLERRVERFRHRMEDAVTRVFTQTQHHASPVAHRAPGRPASLAAQRADDGH